MKPVDGKGRKSTWKSPNSPTHWAPDCVIPSLVPCLLPLGIIMEDLRVFRTTDDRKPPINACHPALRKETLPHDHIHLESNSPRKDAAAFFESSRIHRRLVGGVDTGDLEGVSDGDYTLAKPRATDSCYQIGSWSRRGDEVASAQQGEKTSTIE